MKVQASTVFTLVLALIAGAMVFASRKFPVEVGLYVWAAGIPVLFLCILILVNDIRRAVSGGVLEVGKGVRMDIASTIDMGTSATRRKVVVICLWFAALYIGIWLVGLKVTLAMFFPVYLTLEARTRWYQTLLLTAGAVLFLIYFDALLKAFWPEGILKQWLPWLP